jgi:hypothetical protein
MDLFPSTATEIFFKDLEAALLGSVVYLNFFLNY